MPNSDHILRYIRPTDIDNGVIGGSGFLRRQNESSLSVNWLECFCGDLNSQVEEVRRRARITYAAKGKLARLNVENVCRHVASQSNTCRLRVAKNPLLSENNYEEDPSHALVEGVPSANDPEGEFIGDLIAECLIDSFPARSSKTTIKAKIH